MSASHDRQRPLESYRSENTLVNALIGAVVTVILAFLPFSPVLGGAAAGYLQRGDRSGGLRVGALSGAFGAVPIVLLGGLLFGGMILGMMAGAARLSTIVGAVLLVVVGLALAYTIGLGAVGGYLGVLLAEYYEE